MAWKYIVFEIETPSRIKMELPVIFPDKLVHADVAEALHRVLRKTFHHAMSKPLSAGAISMVRIPFGTEGESKTLKLKSRTEDDDVLIESFEYSHGIK